jgi:hypothetical protein
MASLTNENLEFTYYGLVYIHDIETPEVKVTNEEYEFTYYGLVKVIDLDDKSTSRRLLMGVG